MVISKLILAPSQGETVVVELDGMTVHVVGGGPGSKPVVSVYDVWGSSYGYVSVRAADGGGVNQAPFWTETRKNPS